MPPLRRGILALAGLAALALLASFAADGVARSVVETWGSEAAGAPVHLGSADVSLLQPQLVLHGLVVENPPGFGAEPALSVRRLAIGVDPGTLTGDVVTVTEVTADGVELCYSRSGGESNLDAIESRILAFLEKRKLGSGPRLLLDRLVARDAKATAPVVLGRASVPLQGLEYRDIGRREGGLTPPAMVAALFDLMEPSLASALAHTDYGALFRSGARGVEGAARKLKELFE